MAPLVPTGLCHRCSRRSRRSTPRTDRCVSFSGATAHVVLPTSKSDCTGQGTTRSLECHAKPSFRNLTLGSNVLFGKPLVFLPPTVNLFLSDFSESLGVFDLQHSLLHHHSLCRTRRPPRPDSCPRFSHAEYENARVSKAFMLALYVWPKLTFLLCKIFCGFQRASEVTLRNLLPLHPRHGFCAFLPPESWQVQELAPPVSVVVGPHSL